MLQTTALWQGIHILPRYLQVGSHRNKGGAEKLGGWNNTTALIQYQAWHTQKDCIHTTVIRLAEHHFHLLTFQMPEHCRQLCGFHIIDKCGTCSQLGFKITKKPRDLLLARVLCAHTLAFLLREN